MVALGVTYEQMLESLLGVTAEQMTDLARVYLSADLYDMYVTDTKSSLSLLVRAQEVSVGDRELGMSLQNGGLGNNGKDAYRICLKLSLLLTVDGSSTEMPMLDGNYVVQLPVPEAMLSADGCAVAFYDVQNGLQKAEAVTPVEGYIRFVIKQEGTYALIGVYESAQGGGLFWPILIIVFGCLLVVCGALLVWLRFSGAAVVAGMLGGKPAKEAAAEEAADEPEGLTVPTAAEEAVAEPTPAAVADEVIAAAAPAAVAAPAAEEEYEDIFSSAERRDAFNKRDE
jgi:hypothetical protein